MSVWSHMHIGISYWFLVVCVWFFGDGTLYSYKYYIFFFFQAEDGIRDLVRSRGLGDVYKRQIWNWSSKKTGCPPEVICAESGREKAESRKRNPAWTYNFFMGSAWVNPVSYTHLTLPTSDLV